MPIKSDYNRLEDSSYLGIEKGNTIALWLANQSTLCVKFLCALRVIFLFNQPSYYALIASTGSILTAIAAGG